MAVDTNQIMEMAEKLGQLVGQHPAVEKYRQAQKSLADDADANRLVNTFNRQLMQLAQQEESGMPVTDAQRMQLEGLQSQLASHLKVKAMNLAQVEFVNVMRQISDTIRKHVHEAAPTAPATGPQQPVQPGGPRMVF
ncbi:MAG: YlbF family regulator [Tepidisphaeraceae bacterium]|jgi:cell fate (sporulation/competence/biofilm development) regulator YlbF (YheA/YmcA/DUF963 family)